MEKKLVVSSVVALLVVPALAIAQAPAGGGAAGGSAAGGMQGMDMSKMGPLAKLPKDEKKDQKELQEFFKAWDEAEKKGDADAVADMVDFPVVMMSDTMDGKFRMNESSREQWLAMMKPMMTPEAAKTMKMSGHKVSCVVFSDDLASCESTGTMESGKQKGKVTSEMVMTRVDGKWKMKTMMEAGWGDMHPAQGQMGGTPGGMAPTK